MNKTEELCVGERRKARNIPQEHMRLAFGKGYESEFSDEENQDWLGQFHRPVTVSQKAYLIDDETYPTVIWESCGPEDKDPNHLDHMYKLVWVDPEAT